MASGEVQRVGRLYVITAEGLDAVMKETRPGDYQAWLDWLDYCSYAQAHTDGKFYDQFQKLVAAVHAKAQADVSFIRWLVTDFSAFSSCARAHLVSLGAEVVYLLGKNDVGIVPELQDFLAQHYVKTYTTLMKPVTLQEQLQTWYVPPAAHVTISEIPRLPEEKEDD